MEFFCKPFFKKGDKKKKVHIYYAVRTGNRKFLRYRTASMAKHTFPTFSNFLEILNFLLNFLDDRLPNSAFGILFFF